MFEHEFTVAEQAIDANGHVNNVMFVQWMQDVAVLHSDASGATRAVRDAGCTWVVRSHNIEYLKSAFAGDEIIAQTWVASFQKVRSVRRYRFIRKHDSSVLARGATEWVCVEAQTGRPRKIPQSLADKLPPESVDDE